MPSVNNCFYSELCVCFFLTNDTLAAECYRTVMAFYIYMHETNVTYQKDFIPKCNLFLTMWGSWTGEWLGHVHYMDKSSGAAMETKAMFGV